MRVSVVMLFRNNSLYIPDFSAMCTWMERECASIQFEYYFYENDSTDDTVHKLHTFMRNRTGRIFSEQLNKPTQEGIDLRRGEYMATLRNRTKQLHGRLHTEATLLLDTNLLFTPYTLQQLLACYHRNLMITAFTTTQASPHYYDTLALRFPGWCVTGHHNNLCPFEGCHKCQQDAVKIGRTPLQVESAFGGMALLSTALYMACDWGPDICEHYHFCEQVRHRGGKILCVPTIRASMMTDPISHHKCVRLLSLLMSLQRSCTAYPAASAASPHAHPGPPLRTSSAPRDGSQDCTDA